MATAANALCEPFLKGQNLLIDRQACREEAKKLGTSVPPILDFLCAQEERLSHSLGLSFPAEREVSDRKPRVTGTSRCGSGFPIGRFATVGNNMASRSTDLV
jgi:hypothetical protein